MLRAARYVDGFYKVAQEPVWRLLDTLKSPAGRLRIEAALTESRVDPAEFAAWRPAIVQRDIRQAVAHLVARGYPIPAPALAQPPIPAWVVLYLALYKVRTADHAAAPLLDLLAPTDPADPDADPTNNPTEADADAETETDDGLGEYGRLVRWIRGWVGEKRVPGERALAKWRGVVREMRAGREAEG